MKPLLFPHRFQKPALLLTIAFGILVVLNYQYNFELSFLALPAPPDALLSNGNLTDEVFLTGFLLSLLVYGFSREVDEDEYSVSLRFRALVFAVLAHTLISIALINLVFGWAFPMMAAYHLFTVLILYVLFYKTQRLLILLRTLRSS